jgi:DNA-binding transcriptional ArsR family regulator
MREGPDIARIAAAIGDHARAEILAALMADRALTAGELGHLVGVTKATVSAHLSKLVDVGLLAVEQQGRHRYFRLADADVGELLESLMGVAFRAGAVRLIASPREPALRKARVCYDHLAGELGVRLYEGLVDRNLLKRRGDSLSVTAGGGEWFKKLEIDVEEIAKLRRAFCRPCLDWSERRTHIAGGLGKALLERFEELGWARRETKSRVITFSAAGERSLMKAILT